MKINDRCVKCGACKYVCKEGAIYDSNKKYEINNEKCTNCGKCIDKCPIFAIKQN
ncbi:MAG: 4Fe-4S binding protein [Eubacterium sp.]